MGLHRRWAAIAGLALAAIGSGPVLTVAAGTAQRPAAEPYAWKSVSFVGGGFVTGMVFHPTAKDVRYCRTDIGGAYRWNGGGRRAVRPVRCGCGVRRWRARGSGIVR